MSKIAADDLRSMKKAIEAIEDCYANGVTISYDGDAISVDSAAADETKARAIIEGIKSARTQIVEWMTDAGKMRNTLALSQERIVSEEFWLSTNLDLWPRLEAIYRAMHPDNTQCIRGSKECLDLEKAMLHIFARDTVVRCAACEGRDNGEE